jgi:hypothetical protein
MEIPNKLDGAIVGKLIEGICKFDVQITEWCVAYDPDGKAIIHKAVYEQLRQAFRLVERLQHEIAEDSQRGGAA